MRRKSRKLNIWLLTLALAAALLCVAPAALAVETGVCGEGLTWSLSGDTLTISGSGEMWDFPERTMAPWYEYREQISTVVLPDGLTRVGDLAFYECSALKTVSLPDSVEEVGWYSFALCSGMSMLDLGDNLRTIEEGGFRDCGDLSSVRLPSSLTALGFQAFYRCESLTAVTVPASVTDMGMTVFAYCSGLVRADIRADITILPDWTFYGCTALTDVSLPASVTTANEFAFYDCDSLSNVNYEGSKENRKQIEKDIARDLEGNSGSAFVSDNPVSESSSNTVFAEKNGDIVAETITAIETENASISTKVTTTYPGGSADESMSSAQIDVTLENSNGWNEAIGTIREVVENTESVQMDVFLKGMTELERSALKDLAGEEVNVQMQNAAGSRWQIDCSTLEATVDKKTGMDLTYERTSATEKQTKLLNGAVGYQIKFLNDVELNAQVMIKLPVEHAYSKAYLYQVVRDKAEFLQAVLVDNEGYAHFYLASVDNKTEYLVGINVVSEQTQEQTIIIPETLHAEYGITERLAPVEYVITGRTSSWGMNITQVTWIMIGVLVVVVVGVGVTMFLLNKRKLKLGYVPDLDDEE